MPDQKCALRIDDILEKALCGRALRADEIVNLLSLNDRDNINRVFRTARFLREENFGNTVFLYGFLYFSTFCRNNCRFCGSRISNPWARRYRKSEEESIEAACRLAESGVHLIDLTMGEDPLFYCSDSGFTPLLELISKIKSRTNLPLMISPGVVPLEVLAEFAQLGVEWYACYQETHNRRLFAKLRPEQDYDTRLYTKAMAKRKGMMIEEGIMTGVGESLPDIAHSINEMRDLDVHQARVMSFVPQRGTPMARRTSPPRLRELLTIAVLRLLFPDRLIPASLDVDGLDYVQERLEAGANVITSLIPPHLGLSGVSQSFLGIDEGFRTVKGVAPVLEKASLAAARPQDYRQWIDRQRPAKIDRTEYCEVLA